MKNMEIFRLASTKIYVNVLKFLVFLLVISSSFMLGLNKFNNFVSLILFAIIIGFEIFTITNTKMNNTSKLILILIIGFVLRVFWILNANNLPVSDFEIMYKSAERFLLGDTSAFHGTAYIARFPHLTIMVLYMALIKKIFPNNNFLVMKSINLIFALLTIYFLYKLVKEIFNSEKLALYSAAITSVFPALITYVGVFCTENLAIPFYILSVYLFVLVMKNKLSKHYLILSGVLLSVGNLFRMVALIVLVAYVAYVILYNNDKIIEKIKKVFLFLIPYFFVLVFVSSSLQFFKITEFPLWNGSEPKITNILKGTNIESGGRWNDEDARIVDKYNYDYSKIEEESRKIILERFRETNPLTLVVFYFKKYLSQWSFGDFGGVYWSKAKLKDDNIFVDLNDSNFQFPYVVVVVLIFLGLIGRKNYNEYVEINLIYIIICGYGLMNLITETQARYSLIAAWLLIIASVEGIRYIYLKFKNGKYL